MPSEPRPAPENGGPSPATAAAAESAPPFARTLAIGVAAGGQTDLELETLFATLKAKTGHDFSAYKKNTLLRRIDRRMTVTGAGEFGAYLALLADSPLEAQALCQELLIGVTSFFRDPEAFEQIRQDLIPRLFTDQGAGKPIRIWHACCATGEEVYSVAILIREHLDREGLQARVQIFATDLDGAAVAQARAGIYGDEIKSAVGPALLEKYFTAQDDHWQVTAQLREMIVFARHSIIKDPPFSRLDLLVCRNFLIYLNPDIQKRLIPLFYRVLNPGGFLFLGSAETVGIHSDLFSPVDKKWKIFTRRECGHRVDTLFPYTSPPRGCTGLGGSGRSVDLHTPAPVALADKLLMDRYVPARVIVNEKNEVIHFSNRAGAYLLPPEGGPTRDLLRMAREELRPALRAATYKAFSEQRESHFHGIKVAGEGIEGTVNIVVVPFTAPPPDDRLALVIFEPAPSSQPRQGKEEKNSRETTPESLVSQLEEQLRVTGEQLQVSNEQLEATNESFLLANEELMATNEELQSANEELQATNEELETSKDELQAMNEELNQSNSDLENLFTSAEIAIIFLDRGLIIKRFSPALAAIFNLIPSDIGRPFGHLNGPVDLSNLADDAALVLEQLVPIEREVVAPADGRNFIMRTRPYRTGSGLINGIVVTLIDISHRKRIEEALRQNEQRLSLFIDQAPASLAMFDTEMRYLSVSRRWLDDYRLGDRDLVGQCHYEVFPEISVEWREAHQRALTGEILQAEAERFQRADGSVQWLRWKIQPWLEADDRIGGIVIFTEDITELLKAEELLRRYELLAKNSRDIFLFVRAEDGRILEANAAAVQAYGYPHEELLTRTIADLRDPATHEVAEPQMRTALSQGLLFETVHRRKDGSTFPVEVGSQGAEMNGTRILLSVIRDITERTRAETAAHEAAELRRLSLEAARLGAWEYTLPSGEVFWDQQCRDLWGLPSGNRIDYGTAIDRIHPADREATDKAVQQALAGIDDGAYHREFRVIWPDGTEHWIASHGRVYFQGQGEQRRPIRFVGVNREVTAERRSEAMRAQLAAIVASSEAAIIAKDLDGIIVSWNGGAQRLFGYPPQEVIGQPITLLIPPEMHREAQQKLQQLVTGARIDPFETVRIARDGQRIEVSLSLSPIKDSEGRITGISKIARNITDRKRAEEALRANRAKLEAALASMTDAVSITDASGRLIEYNHAFATFHRLADKKACGATFADCTEGLETYLANGELAPLAQWPTPRALRGEAATNAIYTHRRRDSGESWIGSYSFSPIRDPQGAIDGAVVVGRDITELKQHEEIRRKLETRLQQAQKMEAIGTLAGGIAHDFNNILGAIIGYAEIASDCLEPESPVLEPLNKVLQAGHRASSLVRQILTFSRQSVIEPTPLQPAIIIKEAIKILRPSLPSTITIKPRIEVATRPILADATQVHQILMNLCTNAFHAMEQTGGILEISLKDCKLSPTDLQAHPGAAAGSFIVLSVRDSGTGIAPEIQERIFDPYFTTKQIGKGTGMGLSIIHGIIKSYGGCITCESVPGKGTTFHVYFPALTQELIPDRQATAPIESGKERILFVDDEELLGELGKTMLERLGYAVTVRTSSMEAWNTFQNNPGQFDAVITDQTMPGMTGGDLALKMLQIRPELPIILCTGYSSIISEQKAKSQGIKGFAMKPLTRKEIATLLRQVLDQGKRRS